MNKQQCQWGFHGDFYSPVGSTINTLPAGVYVPKDIMGEVVGLAPRTLETDQLVLTAESPVYQIIDNVRRFWKRKGLFDKLGLVHKRGVLIYGGPGGGKSCTIELLAKDIIADDGIVLKCNNIWSVDPAIRMIRSVEPDVRLAVVLEDIDEYMDTEYSNGGETTLSNLLDGIDQVGNIVFLATTNYINAIPARFKNRPSRFDEVVEIGLPSEAMRLAFLQAKIPTAMQPAMLTDWALDTEGFSLAHLRELIVGVLALGRPYAEVLARLRQMNEGDVQPTVESVEIRAVNPSPQSTGASTR